MPMTARLIFEATLIELSKQQAPSLKLNEFNYLFNKAINQYINKVYNVYDINQLTTDDLRVLKSTAYLTPKKWNQDNSATHNKNRQASSYLSKSHSSIQSLHGANYEVEMPIDYLHLLNCVCIYYVAKQKDCWDAGSYIEIPATRLTADSWSQIITDIYNRPSPMKPYYYIHNQNNSTNNDTLPTDPITSVSSSGMPNGTDMTGIYRVESNGIALKYAESGTAEPVVKQFLMFVIGNTYYEVVGEEYYRRNNIVIPGNPTIELGYTYVGTAGNAEGSASTLDSYTLNNGKYFTLIAYTTNEINSSIYAKNGNDWYYVNGLSINNINLVKIKEVVTFTKVPAGTVVPEKTLVYSTMFYPDPEQTITIVENGSIKASTLLEFTGKSNSNFPRTFKLDINGDGTPDTNISLVEKPIAVRIGNASNVRMEIRYGK